MDDTGMTGTRQPDRKPYVTQIWREQVAQRAQIKACMDAIEKLATMVQVLSQAYARIINVAQASAAEEERQQAAGADAGKGETVSEGGIILGGKEP